MAIRHLCACICVMFLLQVVAFAAAQAPAPPHSATPDPFDPAEPPSADPAAYERLRHAHASCYRTVTHVPLQCAREFIKALFTGRSVMDFAITADCCHQLACVREWTCADVLRGVCVPPERDLCPPPESPPRPPAMARDPSATGTKQ